MDASAPEASPAHAPRRAAGGDVLWLPAAIGLTMLPLALAAQSAGRDAVDPGAGSGLASPTNAIRQYEQSLPPDRQEGYKKLRYTLLRKSFTDLYIIKFYGEGRLCENMNCYGISPALVKTVAESIIQGRKDEEAAKAARSTAKNSTIASVSAMVSTLMSLATLAVTLLKRR